MMRKTYLTVPGHDYPLRQSNVNGLSVVQGPSLEPCTMACKSIVASPPRVDPGSPRRVGIDKVGKEPLV